MIDINTAFSSFPALETERIILRELSFDDAAEMWEMNNDAEILTNMHYGVKYKAYDTILHLYGLFNTKQAITWGLALRESNELIGLRSLLEIESASKTDSHFKGKCGNIEIESYTI